MLSIKDRLGHGNFGPWLQSEFQMAERTAQRYMGAAAVFSDKSDIVSVLPPSAVYALSAPSTPAPVREEVVRRLEAGERLPADDVRDMVRAAKRAEEQTRKEARITPGERKKRQQADDRRERENQRRRGEWMETMAKQQDAQMKVAQMILAQFGPALPELLALLDDAGERSLKMRLTALSEMARS